MNFTELNIGTPQYLYFLLLIPVLGFYIQTILTQEKKQRNKITPKIKQGLKNPEDPEYRLSSLSLTLIITALLITSLIRPQIGYQLIEGMHEGVDLIIAADVSESMLAEDVKPDRMNVSRRKINDLLEIVTGDRVALISFAGASFIESPLTLDHGSIKLISKTLATDLVPLKGSNFESAAVSAAKLFVREKPVNTGRTRALIMLTDGEFEEGSLELGLNLLKKSQITPYIIVIGSETGAPVPAPGGFKKDVEGKTIISKSDINLLNNELEKVGGLALRTTLNDNDLKEIYLRRIKTELTQSKLAYNNVRKWNEYYQYSLALAVFLIIFAWKTPKQKRPKASSINVTSLTILLFAFLFLPASLNAQNLSRLNKGNQLYEAGKFNEALEEFLAQEETNANAFEKHLATGNTYYRLGDFKKAQEEFGKAQSLAQDPKERGRALFNNANSLAQLGELEKALETFEQAKKELPRDKETDNNIKYIKKLIENLDQNKEKDQQEQNQEQEESQQPDAQESKDKNEQDGQNENSQSQQDKANNTEPEDKESDKKQNQNSEPQQEEKDSGQKSDNEGEKKDESQQDKSEDKKAGKPDGPDDEQLDQPNEEAIDGHMQKDQLEAQLENLEENTGARNQYRYKKALEQMDREQRQIPKMDW